MYDGWSYYFRYKKCAHTLCNAHHLRELKAIWEIDGQVWAQDMMDLFLWMKEEREQSTAKNLLGRLSFYRDSVLAFLRDVSASFDNNQSRA
ncbi:hypothetical protein [Metabacillus litoralis]|uniref:hypothetical protein n=1 Tax=Metabacillus litoralis TaxID=152268 RepID=UPI003975E8EC